MPPLAVAIATIAAAAASTGLGIYEATQTPGAPKTPGTQPLTAAQNRAQTAEVSSALPNLQSLTGGSLSPEYAAQYGATQAGLSNNPQSTGNVQAAINQFFGLNAPGQTGFTPGSVGSGGGTNILDLLMKAVPGTTGGSPLPGSPADEFKGLAG